MFDHFKVIPRATHSSAPCGTFNDDTRYPLCHLLSISGCQASIDVHWERLAAPLVHQLTPLHVTQVAGPTSTVSASVGTAPNITKSSAAY